MVINEGINSIDHSKLPKSDHDVHRSDFDSVKDDLRKQWERETGQTWPEEPNGRKYDAHEIIPNAYNSPLTWWNIHPAAFPNEHQGGIHRSGAPLYDIYPR